MYGVCQTFIVTMQLDCLADNFSIILKLAEAAGHMPR
jgi:hypothetical protein